MATPPDETRHAALDTKTFADVVVILETLASEINEGFGAWMAPQLRTLIVSTTEKVRHAAGQKVEVVKFEKKCPHNVPMKHVKKFGGMQWYEPGDCEPCLEQKRLEEEKAEKEAEEMTDRMAAATRARKEKK